MLSSLHHTLQQGLQVIKEAVLAMRSPAVRRADFPRAEVQDLLHNSRKVHISRPPQAGATLESYVQNNLQRQER